MNPNDKALEVAAHILKARHWKEVIFVSGHRLYLD